MSKSGRLGFGLAGAFTVGLADECASVVPAVWEGEDGRAVTVVAAATAATPATPMMALPRSPLNQWAAAFRLAGDSCRARAVIASSRAARPLLSPSGVTPGTLELDEMRSSRGFMMPAPSCTGSSRALQGRRAPASRAR